MKRLELKVVIKFDGIVSEDADIASVVEQLSGLLVSNVSVLSPKGLDRKVNRVTVKDNIIAHTIETNFNPDTESE